MGLFRKKEAADRLINEMRLSERESVILSLEAQRDEVVEDIEAVMKEISKEMRQRKLKRRNRR